MIINHNLAALNTYNKMSVNTATSQKSLEKLSSGLRINRAGDDAAGLVISEKMRAQVRGLDQAGRNAQDGISLIQTAEGGLNEVHSILQRMRELADQSANGTNTTDDRSAIQSEISQLKSEIDRIGNTTEFNTQKLLNGSLQSAGASVGTNQTLGGVVAKLTSAKLTGAAQLQTSTLISATFTDKDTFVIDGNEIEVNWDVLLSQAEKDKIQQSHLSSSETTLNSVKDIITNTLNEAIDNYNTSTGATVDHVKSYYESSSDYSMVFESSTSGVKSQVTLKSIASSKSVGALIATDVASTKSNVTVGSANYNGSTVAINSTFDFTINGVALEASLGAAITNTSTTMGSAATLMQSAVNVAISLYNSINGKTAGDAGYIQLAKVTASDDGRLVVADETGPITFSDLEGKTYMNDLGLSKAQTEAAGNGGMTFQIGANKNQTITFGIGDMRTTALGITGVDVSTASGAQMALGSLDGAIKSVSTERAKLGAVQNRLEHTVNNLSTSSENLTAAESRIRDVDMAKEMMNFSKMNILTQAAQAMMAQANQQPQGVLQLLR